ncbi:MAG: hypothetical protein ACTSVW_01810 [Candidatus Njordarchaeales archaeon]
MAQQNAFRWLLKNQLTYLIQRIQKEISISGSASDFTIMGLSNILDEIIKEKLDARRAIRKLVRIVNYILNPEDKIKVRILLGYYYSKVGNLERAITYFQDAINNATRINQRYAGIELLCSIIKYLVKAGMNYYVKRAKREILEKLPLLPEEDQVCILSKLGIAIAGMDFGESDFIITDAEQKLASMEESTKWINALNCLLLGYSKLYIGAEREQKIKSLLNRVFHLSKESSLQKKLTLLSRVIGIISLVDKAGAEKILESLLIQARRFGLNGITYLINIVESLSEVYDNDLVIKICREIDNIIELILEFDNSQKIVLLSKLLRNVYKIDPAYAQKIRRKIDFLFDESLFYGAVNIEFLQAIVSMLIELKSTDLLFAAQKLRALVRYLENRIKNELKLIRFKSFLVGRLFRYYPKVVFKLLSDVTDFIKNLRQIEILNHYTDFLEIILNISKADFNLAEECIRKILRIIGKEEDIITKIDLLTALLPVLLKIRSSFGEQILDYTQEIIESLPKTLKLVKQLKLAKEIISLDIQTAKKIIEKIILDDIGNYINREYVLQLLKEVLREFRKHPEGRIWVKQIEIFVKDNFKNK